MTIASAPESPWRVQSLLLAACSFLAKTCSDPYSLQDLFNAARRHGREAGLDISDDDHFAEYEESVNSGEPPKIRDYVSQYAEHVLTMAAQRTRLRLAPERQKQLRKQAAELAPVEVVVASTKGVRQKCHRPSVARR